MEEGLRGRWKRFEEIDITVLRRGPTTSVRYVRSYASVCSCIEERKKLHLVRNERMLLFTHAFVNTFFQANSQVPKKPVQNFVVFANRYVFLTKNGQSHRHVQRKSPRIAQSGIKIHCIGGGGTPHRPTKDERCRVSTPHRCRPLRHGQKKNSMSSSKSTKKQSRRPSSKL